MVLLVSHFLQGHVCSVYGLDDKNVTSKFNSTSPFNFILHGSASTNCYGQACGMITGNLHACGCILHAIYGCCWTLMNQNETPERKSEKYPGGG